MPYTKILMALVILAIGAMIGAKFPSMPLNAMAKVGM
jgi:hypothetical protein